MHPTYFFQQGKIKLHANQQKIFLEKRLNFVSLLGKGLNVVSLFEESTQCRISTYCNTVVHSQKHCPEI